MSNPIRIPTPEPVHAVLELSEDEAYWLVTILRLGARLSQQRADDGVLDAGLTETALHVAAVGRVLENRVATALEKNGYFGKGFPEGGG